MNPNRIFLVPKAAAGLLWMATATVATGCFVALSMASAYAQDTDAPRQKTESPYFFVKNPDANLDALPLKSTQVDVRIAGVIADVTVTQVYRNDGKSAIDAQYVFPGSTRAAVYAMNVRLADRLLTADIREKQQARIEFDAAKKEGKTAALLEQHRPNVFQMNVANIMPGDDVKVELRYTELLVPQSGNYQFVFPTVVGPRYNSPQSADANSKWVSQGYTRAVQTSGDASLDKSSTPKAPPFDIKVHMVTPVGIKEVKSSSHGIDVERGTSGQDSDKRAEVSLRQGAAVANNRDFILDYRLSGDRIESGVMLYKGDGGKGGENFFLAMVEPPKYYPSQSINPRDYIFVVDISGSMGGFPLDTSKEMLRNLIGKLRPTDTFNVMLFSGSNRMLGATSVPATQANIDRAIHEIDNSRAGGSTELIPALKRVYAQPKTADVSRTIVVVTDGYVTVEQEAFDLVRRNLGQANLFSFGIGSSVNRHLMEGLARAGMGEPFIITKPSEAAAQGERFRQMIQSPILTSVKARFEGIDTYDVEPAQLPDVFGERPVIVFGKWRAGASGEAAGRLIIEGQASTGPYSQTLQMNSAAGQGASALRYLWARHRIASLSDQESLDGGQNYRQRILDLGLQYNLLTQYTSFLAVDKVVRNPDPASTPTMNQPLPMPEGVSNLAIGAEVPGTPEPGTWISMFVMLSLLAMLARRHRRMRRRTTEDGDVSRIRFTA